MTTEMRRGGVETFLLRIGVGLKNKSCQVDIITTEGEGAWFELIARNGLSAKNIGSGQTARWLIPPCVRLLNIARELWRGRYDVIFLNHAPRAQATIGWLPSDVAIVPIVHNDTHNIYTVAAANSAVWNAAVCASPRLVEKFQGLVKQRPILFIPYGVDIPEEWRRNENRTGKAIRLSFVGRLTNSQKGIFLLPEILKQCRSRGINVDLVVAGTGPDERALRAMLGDACIETTVTFLGNLVPRDVYELLKRSDILLLPSFYEGLGIILQEAMACGCVPIASKITGVTDYLIINGVNGYLPEIGDVSGFVEAIAALSCNRDMLCEMSLAAQERARSEFSCEAMTERYWNLISNLLADYYPLPKKRRMYWGELMKLMTWRDMIPEPLLSALRRARGAT